MNKKIQVIATGAALIASAFLWTGCSDAFLEEKTNYNQLSPDIYNDYTGASMRVRNIYLDLQPIANAPSGFQSYKWQNYGGADVFSRATEEFTGTGSDSWYVNPEMSSSHPRFGGSGAPAMFSESDKTSESPWGSIRNCNDVIEGVSNSTLTDEQKKELLGQVYFFRAWQYYLLVKNYGGVPIIDRVLAADLTKIDEVEEHNYRRTTKECIDWICAELEKAAEMLPSNWTGDFGRVTKGTALAVAGRARLLYASPLFNRQNDPARWRLAYEANKKAVEELRSAGFGLAYSDGEYGVGGVPGINAAGFSKMFSDYNSLEAVFVTLYNNLPNTNEAHETWRNNGHEQRVRPRNASGTSDGWWATEIMVDLFPMADGKRPGGGSQYAYTPGQELLFYKDRDPRFYRTFAFPGVTWRYEGDVTGWTDAPEQARVYPGLNYVLWNYAWYNGTPADDATPGWGADRLGRNYRGVYVRKRSNDFDLPPTHPATNLYRVPTANWADAYGGFFHASAQPYMEMRFAEVLLNLAESAVGADKAPEAFDILKAIRHRAGYGLLQQKGVTDANYGLVLGSKNQMFAAVLYERQIELAYEGKRFDDMRRWMLWDGGAGQVPGAPDSWKPTGFGGNTVFYLGISSVGGMGLMGFNGQRRDNFELVVKSAFPPGTGAEANALNTEGENTNDPLRLVRRSVTPLDLQVEFSYGDRPVDTENPGAGTYPGQNTTLDAFYNTHLERRRRRGDQKDERERVITFYPQNYFIGLSSSAQNRNPKLQQTMGWADVMNGDAPGTFDPLAE